MKYNLYIIICLLGFFMLNACQDEDLIRKSEVKEGIPVVLGLKLGTSDKEKIATRADLAKDDERKVFDVYVYVFKKSGGDWIKEAGKLISYEGGVTSGSVTFDKGEVTSGQKRIYAVANYIRNYQGEDKSKGKTILNNIQTLDDLEGLVYELGEESVQPLSGGLMMSGTLNGTVDGASVVPEPTMSSDNVTVDGTIQLKHLNSKITFVVKTDRDDSVFVPKSWQVVHVPKKSNIVPLENDCLKEDDYFNTGIAKFEQFIKGTRIVNDNTYEIYKGGSFSFYMMENLKKAKGTPPDQHMREKEEKMDGLNASQNDLKKKFVYADDYATYVILKGSYYAYEPNSMKVQTSADVIYTLHLGKGSAPFDDFKSERAKDYTYNVTINGVGNIVYEVTTGTEEKQPGAEGAVVRSAQNILIDAHYETQSVIFYQDQLKNLAVRISTPYDKGSEYKINTSGNGSVTSGDFVDYKWVKFCRHKEKNEDFEIYPGDDKYNETYQADQKLLDIKQVLKQLYDNKENNDFWSEETIDGKSVKVARYTVFINEYYYEKEPKGEIAYWKDFVNQPSRDMHILCKTDYSADQESSLTTSSILISQRSIKTIYNTNVETAWGVETINEDEGRLMKFEGQENTNKLSDTDVRSNGRYMTFYQMGLLKANGNNKAKMWNDYVNPTNNKNRELTFFGYDGWKDVQYKSAISAVYACLSRNRDLDGDKTIDADEVRWYVPATNQLVGMWVGRDALEPEARLFQADAKKIPKNADDDKRAKYHYLSSNGVRFWSEEGTSIGYNNFERREINVRCVRNLGENYKNDAFAEPSLEAEMQKYVTRKQSGDYIQLTFENMNREALRQFKNSEIGAHPEHSGGDLNKPYAGGFLIDRQNRLQCPSGWRVPNQRELSLILGNLTTSEINNSESSYYKYLGSCTFSDLQVKAGRYYIVNVANTVPYMTITGVDSNIYRCVKDN